MIKIKNNDFIIKTLKELNICNKLNINGFCDYEWLFIPEMAI